MALALTEKQIGLTASIDALTAEGCSTYPRLDWLNELSHVKECLEGLSRIPMTTDQVARSLKKIFEIMKFEGKK
jgi:hypothetical protein